MVAAVGDAPGDATRAIRVMIAEDEPDMRILLRMALERDGRFEVLGEASDGQEAIEMAHRLCPDQIILDLRMPRLGGLEALPQLRDLEATQIVVFSAHITDAAKATALWLGAADVLDKTTKLSAVARALADLNQSHPPAA